MHPIIRQPPMNEEAMLRLNQQHREETSELDAEQLRGLIAQAFHVGLRSEGVDAFLVALDQDAQWDSPNFRWFQPRYSRFIYVDRVIVAADKRGRGLARGLYDELFAAATRARQSLVGCEVNVAPPNPVSDAFHEALGFSEVGRASIHDGRKVVRYLIKAL